MAKCECGCGRETDIAPRVRKKNGYVQLKGTPNRFVFGHGRRKSPYVLNKAGYPRKKMPPDHPFQEMADANGYVTVHRLVMAEHVGRPLAKSEVVHHVDRDITNFALSNLRLFSSSAEHLRHHGEIRGAK